MLVRMKHDRDHGKRNNWLLIKHRDELRARAMTSPTRASLSRQAARWNRCGLARPRSQSRSWPPAPRHQSARHHGTRSRPRAQKAERRASSSTAILNVRAQDQANQRPTPSPFMAPRAPARPSRGPQRVMTGCMRSSSTATACSCAQRMVPLPAHAQGPRLDRQVPGRRQSRRAFTPMRSSMARSSP